VPPSWSYEPWTLDPGVAFLNHGSFGACPRPVLERQAQFRSLMEAEPVRFMLLELPALLDASRRRLASLLRADEGDLAFVTNATSGVNAVLRSLDLKAGDEVVLTDHGYNACRAAMEYVAQRTGAVVRVARVPFPLAAPGEVLDAILAQVTPRTRLALLDHVTSPTAVVFPIAQLVRELSQRGIDTLVDGAHAPGMLPLDLPALGAAYYTGNCHKWLCAPKGAAFLYVRPDRQQGLTPVTVSHGYTTRRADASPFHDLFDWTGTHDPSATLCVGHAIDFLESLTPGGLPALMERQHTLALRGRDLLCRRLALSPPTPDAMIGCMATLPLPEGRWSEMTPQLTGPRQSPLHPLQAALMNAGFQLPVFHWPQPPRLHLRISAPPYITLSHFEALADVLERLLQAG
jgi:isopenicillin-N epimerase